ALQRALDALGAAGGGELLIPKGRFVLKTNVSKSYLNLASAIRVVGYGSATQLMIKGAGITIGALEHVAFQGLTFVGTPEIANDADTAISLSYCDLSVFRDCCFYGLS